MKWILAALIASLAACSTSSDTQGYKTFQDGSQAKFKVGDCIWFKEEVREKFRSDGTPVEVLYVETLLPVEGGYFVRMVHPRIGKPTYHALLRKLIEETHELASVDCP